MDSNSINFRWRMRAPSPSWLGLVVLAWASFFITRGTGVLYLSCILLSWTLLATLVTVRTKHDLSAAMAMPREVESSQVFSVTLTLSNASWWLPLILANVEARLLSSERSLGFAPLCLCAVNPGSAIPFRWKTTVFARGSYLLALGLDFSIPGSLISFHGEGARLEMKPLWVLPQRCRLNSRGLETLASARFDPGAALRVAADASDEFVGLRQWRPGETMRRVDWRATSRTGTIVVKEFKDSAFGEVLVLLDTHVPAADRDLYAWRLERAVSFVSALGSQLAHAGYRVVVKSAGPSPLDVTLAPRQKDARALMRQLTNLVATPSAEDVHALACNSTNANFGLTLFVSLGAPMARSARLTGRSHELNPQATIRYLAGDSRAGLTGLGPLAFQAEETRRLRRANLGTGHEPEPNRLDSRSWHGAGLAMGGLAATIFLDRSGLEPWFALLGVTVGSAIYYWYVCRRQDECLARSLSVPRTNTASLTSRLNTAYASAMTSTLLKATHA